MIFVIGILVLLGIWFPKIGAVGGVLTALMSLVTLSFLVTTPEVYVPNLGGDYPTPQYGFPYLSGVGRLVVKDIIMMAGGLVLFSDNLKKVLKPSAQVF
ncbi:inner membrane protein YkgB [Chryseobacterium sp. StRB126]|nr:inner membrane protein YkgB [Chryseobacterium sp. StRB126]